MKHLENCQRVCLTIRNIVGNWLSHIKLGYWLIKLGWPWKVENRMLLVGNGMHLNTTRCQSTDINYHPVTPKNEMIIQDNLWQESWMLWQAVMIRPNNTGNMEWAGCFDGTSDYYNQKKNLVLSSRFLIFIHVMMENKKDLQLFFVSCRFDCWMLKIETRNKHSTYR